MSCKGLLPMTGFVYFGTDGGYVYCIRRIGDLNHEGVVMAEDASIVFRMAVGAVPAVLVGDMNGEKVTSIDALMIMQVTVGSEPDNSVKVMLFCNIETFK